MTVTALTPRQPPSPPSPLSAGLQLEAALSLLKQAGREELPGEAGSPEWLQSIIDALCDLSVRDALTGLANRRHFEMALGREVDRVARSGEPALLLVLDIDHFKRINDLHGHAVGDGALRAIARVLREGGYHRFDEEPGLWWIRSGIAGFQSDAAAHFYLPERYTDPFGAVTTLTFDPYDLFMERSEDPLGNTVSVLRFDYQGMGDSTGDAPAAPAQPISGGSAPETAPTSVLVSLCCFSGV